MAKAIAEITLMLQDDKVGSTAGGLSETKHLELPDDAIDRFLDGPTSRRIGIVDFDPDTGAPAQAVAAFVPYKATTPNRGKFVTDNLPHDSPQFLAVNAFGTVFETIKMFEERAALGRPVSWAFGTEQLLVVPRAGQWANAFYERATRSLQFFWFDSSIGRIYTALSRDIVAHECGHALLDAVVPSLHDSLTPESIAIHEAIADLVAVLMALRSQKLREAVLEKHKYSISDATAFSSIAEQFGAARPTVDDPHPVALRNLRNKSTMSEVDHRSPHQLSTVLSAIFYESLIDMYETLKQRGTNAQAGDRPVDMAHAANRALGSSETIFRRLLLRGIDYLPPGELTFADVARATMAADRAGRRDDHDENKEKLIAAFAQRFVDRGVVDSVGALDATPPPELAIDPAALADVRDSDWAAYRFVEEHRTAFGIPAAYSFTVLPRVDATKEVGRKAGNSDHYELQRELILKVSWDEVETNGSPAVPASRRRVRTGATLAVLWDDGRPLALVRSDVTAEEQRTKRDDMLTKLITDEFAAVVVAHDVEPSLGTGIEVRVLGDVARITGTQRLLHIEGME